MSKINELEILTKTQSLNSECFIFENYEANWWRLFEADILTTDLQLMPKIEKHMIGFCDASRLRIRPRNDSYAVMIDMNGEQFWFHISDISFEDYFYEKEN